MRLIKPILFILAMGAAFGTTAGTLVTKPSQHSVKETMDRLETIVKGKGMTVFARIDHRANAEKIGEKMPSAEVLIFGNPKMGTRIMLRDVRAGLDLPVRILIYRDFDGKTWIAYHNPQDLKASYNEEGCIAIDQMEKALQALTDAAAK